MKKLFTTAILLLFVSSAFSQEWQWLRISTGSKSVLSYDVNSAGTVFTVGQYNQPMKYDTTTLNLSGSTSAYFAKHDSSGNLLAFLNIHPMFNKVKSDAQGNVLFSGTGYYYSDVNIKSPNIGKDTLRDTASTSFLLLTKFDAQVKPLWKLYYTPQSNAVINTKEIFSDALSNIYLILESNNGTMVIGGKTYNGSKALVKISSAGAVLFFKSLPIAMEEIYGQTDLNNNVYLTSKFMGGNGSTPVTIDGKTATNTNPTYAYGYYDVITLKLNDTGAVRWINLSNNALKNVISTLVGPNGITVDTKGNIFVYGDYNDKIVFGSDTLKGITTDQYTTNPFIAKYNTNGTLIWSKTVTQNTKSGYSFLKVVAGKNDRLYFYGASSYSGGYLNTFELPKVGSSGSSDRFVACFDSNLVNKWYRYMQTAETNNQIAGIGVSANGDMFVTSATYMFPVSLGNIDTATTMFVTYNGLTANGGAYVAKFGGASTVTTGVSEINTDDSFVEIYPNPSSGKFTIGLVKGGTVNLEIINLIGEKIYSATVTNQISDIDLTAFSKGIYFVRINSEGKNYTRKIIIE